MREGDGYCVLAGPVYNSRLEVKWGATLEELRARYTSQGKEDFAADDDYLQWQWYADAVETINAQLTALSES